MKSSTYLLLQLGQISINFLKQLSIQFRINNLLLEQNSSASKYLNVADQGDLVSLGAGTRSIGEHIKLSPLSVFYSWLLFLWSVFKTFCNIVKPCGQRIQHLDFSNHNHLTYSFESILNQRCVNNDFFPYYFSLPSTRSHSYHIHNMHVFCRSWMTHINQAKTRLDYF